MYNSVAVLNMEGFHRLAFRANVDTSVGQGSVYIHDQEPDLGVFFHNDTSVRVIHRCSGTATV